MDVFIHNHPVFVAFVVPFVVLIPYWMLRDWLKARKK
jgi:hypothetical protein